MLQTFNNILSSVRILMRKLRLVFSKDNRLLGQMKQDILGVMNPIQGSYRNSYLFVIDKIKYQNRVYQDFVSRTNYQVSKRNFAKRNNISFLAFKNSFEFNPNVLIVKRDGD